MMTSLFHPILEEIDTAPDQPVSETNLLRRQENLLPKNERAIPEHAEILAFHFFENPDISDKHPHCYVSSCVSKTELGFGEGLELVKQEFVEHWSLRATQAIHPVLKAKYAGLTWQFSERLTGQKPPVDTADKLVGALVKVIKGKLYSNHVDAQRKMGIALALAKKINNKELMEGVKEFIIHYEDSIPVTEIKIYWGGAYDLLIEGKLSFLTGEEHQHIIDQLEARLKFLQDENAEACKAAAKRLARYFMIQQKPDETLRVVKAFEHSMQPLINQSPRIKAAGYLSQIYDFYIRYKLKKEVVPILVQMRKTDKEGVREMVAISSKEWQFSKDKLNDLIDGMLVGDADTVWETLAMHLLPDLSTVEQEMKSEERACHLRYIMPLSLQDKKGRTVAKLMPQDFAGHLLIEKANAIRVEKAFFQFYFTRAEAKGFLSTDIILQFLKRPGIFDELRIVILRRALDAYIKSDYLLFLHLIIPQIEEALRNRLEQQGGSVYATIPEKGQNEKEPKSEKIQLKTMDALLREPLVESSLGAAYTEYFRLVFTEQKGINLRNDMAHGFMDPEDFDRQHADLVLHALLCLGMIPPTSANCI